jgi:UDP-GlcNAc:undecaprenyl-phosphate/decaprenyl-phosphate GlcNAc-1-phosphate transferase
MFFPEQAPSLLQALHALWGEQSWILITSLLVTLLVTPLFRSMAVQLRIYDVPDQRLKPHARPIPYLGGLAIATGVIVPLVLVILWGNLVSTRAVWAVLIGIVIIVTAGLLDDLVSLAPWQKIVAQAAAALVLVAGGVIFRAIPSGIGSVQWTSPDSTLLLVLGIGFQVFLVVAACNAANLLDGLDGLCSGVTAIITVGFLLLATSIVGWHTWGEGLGYQFSTLIIIISMALFGASMGFLPYNFNPASIFMGDAGSMLLGFVCATLMVMFGEKPGLVKWFISSLLIFGLPIFDTSLAYTRRKINGKPVFQGDRSHFYDQLVDRGLTVRQAVLVCYGMALFFVSSGIGVIFVRTRYAALIFLVIVAALALFAWAAGMLRVDEKRPQAPEADSKQDKVQSRS